MGVGGASMHVCSVHVWRELMGWGCEGRLCSDGDGWKEREEIGESKLRREVKSGQGREREARRRGGRSRGRGKGGERERGREGARERTSEREREGER